MPFPAKHIIKVLSAPVRVETFTANGDSDAVTTAITSALSSAGSGGVSVPVQVSAAENEVGIIVTAPTNRIEIADATTGEKFKDAEDNEVYGRLTHATNTYTLSYYSSVDGVETAYSFAAATDIDFDFNYRFDFDRYPADAAIAIGSRNIAQDPKGGSGAAFAEALTVTAQNTLSDLSKTPISPTTVEVLVNGESFDSPSGAFSINGKAITWNAVAARLVLDTTDRVFVRYSTRE